MNQTKYQINRISELIFNININYQSALLNQVFMKAKNYSQLIALNAAEKEGAVLPDKAGIKLIYTQTE